MNRKTMMIVLLALAVAAAGAFASGSKEDQEQLQEQGPGFYGPGPGGCPGYGPGYGPGARRQGRGGPGRGGSRGMMGSGRLGADLEFSEEKVTLSGPVQFQNRIHPEMKAGGRDYQLLVPRFYVYELELKDGQELTVEGYVAQGDEVSYLWVTGAVIDGKQYDLERPGRAPRRGYGMMGPRGW
jgi:hypothetical protein